MSTSSEIAKNPSRIAERSNDNPVAPSNARASTGVPGIPLSSTRVLETFWTPSRVRASEPVQRPALGVGNRKDEHVLLMPFERDDVRKSMDGRLADHRARGSRERPWRVGFRNIGTSIESGRNLGYEIVPQILSAVRRTTTPTGEARHAPQDVGRDARRCSSSFRISVRAVDQSVG